VSKVSKQVRKTISIRRWFTKSHKAPSSFLMAHQHILGYLVPYNNVEDD